MCAFSSLQAADLSNARRHASLTLPGWWLITGLTLFPARQ